MQILNSVVPIFLIIGLGIGARKWNLITPEFLRPANKLVYYIAIPAFLFNAVIRGNPGDHFDPAATCLTLLCSGGLYFSAHLLSKALLLPGRNAGAFILSSVHGNLGYFGLPVVYYYLGEESLGVAAIVCGFLMILQNTLSVLFLQLHAGSVPASGNSRVWTILSKLRKNPVILSVASGIAFSSTGIDLPVIIDRTLRSLGALAPPLALLLIGASLSFPLIRVHFRLSAIAGLVKLFVLPLVGLLVFSLFHVAPVYRKAALILLAAPTATITYILANEMDSEPDLTVAAISLSTLLSCISYPIWLACLEL